MDFYLLKLDHLVIFMWIFILNDFETFYLFKKNKSKGKYFQIKMNV